MAYRTTIHDIANDDLKALQKAGLSALIERAREKLRALAELENPEDHPRVTRLKFSAPKWYRYRDGRIRIIFRFIKSSPERTKADVIQVTMIDLRDDETYGQELARRYHRLEES